jgi:hypothetical protein
MNMKIVLIAIRRVIKTTIFSTAGGLNTIPTTSFAILKE